VAAYGGIRSLEGLDRCLGTYYIIFPAREAVCSAYLSQKCKKRFSVTLESSGIADAIWLFRSRECSTTLGVISE